VLKHKRAFDVNSKYSLASSPTRTLILTGRVLNQSQDRKLSKLAPKVRRNLKS
jgi:hypothetical protein